MTMLAKIQDEKVRVLGALSQHDPTSEEYKHGLDALSSLTYIESHEIIALQTRGEVPEPTPPTEEEPKTVAPAKPEAPAEPAPDKSVVREKLAELKKKGVAIKDLLGEFGAENLSGVAEADYNALLKRAAELAETS